MAKLPFGFDARQPYLNDDGLHKDSTEDAAWAMLDDVQTHLEKCEPLPPELASWLGLAINFSKPNRELGREGNSSEFLQRLGLKKRCGENSQYNRQFKAYWQGRLWFFSTYNEAELNPEQIVKAVEDEMTANGIEEEHLPHRGTLQDWLSEILNGSKRVR